MGARPMDWQELCDLRDSVIATLEATGFVRVGDTQFWDRDTDSAHVTLRPDDGFKMTVNGEVKLEVKRREWKI